MQRWIFRIFLLVLLCLALVVLYANTILSQLAASHKNEIEKLLSEQLGANVVIGSLRPQLEPFPELSASDVKIEGLLPGTPLSISEMELKLRLRPLFSGQFVFEQIEIAIPEHNLTVAHKELELRNFHLRGHLNILDSEIELRDVKLTGKVNGLPFTVLARAMDFSSQSKLLQLTASSLILDKSHAEISGTVGLSDMLVGLKLSNTSLQLATLNSLVGQAKGGQLLKGEILLPLITVEGKVESNLEIAGDVSLKNFSSGAAFSVKDAGLKNLKMTMTNGEMSQVGADVSASAIAVKDREQSYQAARVNGNLILKRSKTLALSLDGAMNVQDFGYADGVTTLKNVTAELRPIKVTVAPKGDVKAQVQVAGSQLLLEHEAIRIHGAKQVTAPLVISVPARGGYSVAGPVTVSGAELETGGHQLQKVTGSVQMLISGPEKSFVSKKLAFVENKQAASVAADFKMFPKEYVLQSALTDYFAGTFKAIGRLDRVGSQTLAIEVDAKDLDLKRLSSFINPASTEESAAGSLNAVFKLKGKRDALPQSLVGAGEFKVAQSKPGRIQLIRKVSRALSTIPMLGGLFDSSKGKPAPETQVLSAKVKLENSIAHFENGVVEHPRCRVELAGTIGFDKKLDLKGDVIVMEETFAALGMGIGPLKRLFGRAGKIVVPIFVRGTLPDVNVEADTKTFIRNYSGFGLGVDIIKGIGEKVGL